MSKQTTNAKYKPKVKAKSLFDGNPTLIINRYWLPKPYIDPVHDVIKAYRAGIPFNRAVDQVAIIYADKVQRDKLAEHTLKSIANDY